MRSDAVEADNAAWEAVLRRDRLQDGAFVWVARTTGIYCRPSCPARRAYRRNVIILESATHAQQLGYVACRRCRPDTLTRAERGIRAVLLYIDSHLDRPLTLDTLAGIAGLSPNHLQRTFGRLVGLSPKAFCDSRRLACFKDHVKRGASISDACYSVGFGSSRALYEKAARLLGMTPAAYQSGANGIRVQFATFDSPFGRALLAATREGLCAVLLGEDGATVRRQLRAEFPNASLFEASVAPEPWSTGVERACCEDPVLTQLPLECRSRIFQAKVWRNLGGRSG